MDRQKFQPYKVHLVKQPQGEERLDFCEKMELLIRDSNFSRTICFSDEANIQLNGYVNRRSWHYWHDQNSLNIKMNTPNRSNSMYGLEFLETE